MLFPRVRKNLVNHNRTVLKVSKRYAHFAVTHASLQTFRRRFLIHRSILKFSYVDRIFVLRSRWQIVQYKRRVYKPHDGKSDFVTASDAQTVQPHFPNKKNPRKYVITFTLSAGCIFRDYSLKFRSPSCHAILLRSIVPHIQTFPPPVSSFRIALLIPSSLIRISRFSSPRIQKHPELPKTELGHAVRRKRNNTK